MAYICIMLFANKCAKFVWQKFIWNENTINKRRISQKIKNGMDTYTDKINSDFKICNICQS